MKTILPYLLALFLALPFALHAEDEEEEGLSEAIDSLRKAEAQFDDDEDEEDDHDDDDDDDREEDEAGWEEALERVTGAQLKAAIDQHYAKERQFIEAIEDEDLREEAEEILEIFGREAVAIGHEEPGEVARHVKVTKAEMAMEYNLWRVHETDEDAAKIRPDLIKAMQAMKQVEIDELRREIAHLQEEIEEIEAWNVEDEVDEILEDR